MGVKCDNCNKEVNNIQIIHQLVWKNLPETYYLCTYCKCKVFKCAMDIDILYNCLLWISKRNI